MLFRAERLDGDAVASLDQPHLHALCRDLLPAGTVVVTLGASGCFVSHADDALRGDDRAFYRLGAEHILVVDSTGAGDAFNRSEEHTSELKSLMRISYAVF